ncbi:MAG: hypothetical protein E7052_10975 [Lentisphaerae bacterium]|nr:hypothetical protein [Lentisphaerota bacterium]
MNKNTEFAVGIKEMQLRIFYWQRQTGERFARKKVTIMKNLLGRCVCAILLLTVLTGCVSAEYRGESFPATLYINTYQAGQKLPENCVFIGRGVASGEYSGTTESQLLHKLQQLGLAHGADALVVMGCRIVPDGNVADSAREDFISATDAPDQASTEIEFNNIIEDQAAQQSSFIRIMYADFLRYKRNLPSAK